MQELSPEEKAQMIKSKGLEPVWKDWNESYAG